MYRRYYGMGGGTGTIRGVVIAGTHSGCGKTTVSLGVMAALRKRGLSVQPFKAGPDFIDAGLHRLAAGRISRNLDLWMCGPDYVRACFAKHGAAAEIAVVEGVMGLYDGDRSTAVLAAQLQVPVVLVVDAYGMAESAGAVVQGFADFGSRSSDSRFLFGGVIFNRVASEGHFARLRESVRGVPVFGYLPRELDFEIPHRHLGLMTAEEDPLGSAVLEKLAATVARYIDIDAILRRAGHASGTIMPREDAAEEKSAGTIRIAVARDKAFSFYYEDNLDMLRDAGAEIIEFSPMRDRELPADAGAVYLGGGYPELHAGELSRNGSMLESVRAWAQEGKPLYAECGGLMYLSRTITREGAEFPMAGVFPFSTAMLAKPRLGYREVQVNRDCLVGSRGAVLRGHEFHYSEIRDNGAGTPGAVVPEGVYSVRDNRGRTVGNAEGFRYKNTLASYVHLHFGSRQRGAEHVAGFIKGAQNL